MVFLSIFTPVEKTRELPSTNCHVFTINNTLKGVKPPTYIHSIRIAQHLKKLLIGHLNGHYIGMQSSRSARVVTGIGIYLKKERKNKRDVID
jgi:hypothetical protein